MMLYTILIVVLQWGNISMTLIAQSVPVVGGGGGQPQFHRRDRCCQFVIAIIQMFGFWPDTGDILASIYCRCMRKWRALAIPAVRRLLSEGFNLFIQYRYLPCCLSGRPWCFAGACIPHLATMLPVVSGCWHLDDPRRCGMDEGTSILLPVNAADAPAVVGLNIAPSRICNVRITGLAQAILAAGAFYNSMAGRGRVPARY